MSIGLLDGSTLAWEANTRAWNAAGAAAIGAGGDGGNPSCQRTNWSAATFVGGPALLVTEISPIVTARNPGVSTLESACAVNAVTSLLEIATEVSPIENFSPWG